MLLRVAIENFKSLQRVELDLGRLNLFIGTNASGKSNLADALRVLRGMAGGDDLGTVFDGSTDAHQERPVIRGGLRNAFFRSQAAGEEKKSPEAIITARYRARDGVDYDYQYGFSAEEKTTRESLSSGERLIFKDSGYGAWFYGGDKRPYPGFSGVHRGSGISTTSFNLGLPEEFHALFDHWREAITGLQFLDPDCGILREPGMASETTHLFERGGHFPDVVRFLCSDPETKAAYLAALRELLRTRVDDIGVKPGGDNLPQVFIREGTTEFSAPSLSDGTLRVAAFATAFFQEPRPSGVVMEAIETHFSPARFQAFLELLATETRRTGIQVFATTHVPAAAEWAIARRDPEIRVFHFRRDPESGATHIRPLNEAGSAAPENDLSRLRELLAED